MALRCRFAFTDHCSDLRDGQARDESQYEDFTCVLVQSTHKGAQVGKILVTHQPGLNAMLGTWLQGFGQQVPGNHAAPPAVEVRGGIPGDAEQPRSEGASPAAVAGQGIQGFEGRPAASGRPRRPRRLCERADRRRPGRNSDGKEGQKRLDRAGPPRQGQYHRSPDAHRCHMAPPRWCASGHPFVRVVTIIHLSSDIASARSTYKDVTRVEIRQQQHVSVRDRGVFLRKRPRHPASL